MQHVAVTFRHSCSPVISWRRVVLHFIDPKLLLRVSCFLWCSLSKWFSTLLQNAILWCCIFLQPYDILIGFDYLVSGKFLHSISDSPWFKYISTDHIKKYGRKQLFPVLSPQNAIQNKMFNKPHVEKLIHSFHERICVSTSNLW